MWPAVSYWNERARPPASVTLSSCPVLLRLIDVTFPDPSVELVQRPFASEGPGVSVFYKDAAGQVFHTYSTYARGLDMLNVAYHYLDIVPKGRDEGDNPIMWVRRHDEYDR